MAEGGGSIWRRTAGVALAAAVVLTIALSLWAALDAPPRTLLDRRRVGSGAEVVLDDQRPSSRWWRAALDLDHHLRPGPAWILHAGEPGEPGHSLRWDPEELSLHLLRRRPPGAGPLPTPSLLIATIPLGRAPDRLEWVRRDHLHLVRSDGEERGRWEDALPAPGTRSWHTLPTGDLGVTRIAIHDDVHLQRAAERAVVDAPGDILDAPALRVLVRRAIALSADSPEGVAAREAAANAMTVLGSDSPGGLAMAPWLAWDTARSALVTNPELPTLPLADGVDRLAAFGGDPAPGLALLLVPGLTWRAARAPVAPLPARGWIEQRREWLTTTARACDVRSGIAALDWELALLAHVARVLAGAATEPTPTDAPGWVTTRWRLAAGLPLPREDQGAIGAIPPLPPPGRPSIRAATTLLLGHAGLADADAARLRAEVLGALARAQPTDALRALQVGPPLARVRTRALLALYGIGSVEQARAGLAADAEGGGGSWRALDPLAWALDRLLAHRSGTLPPPTATVEPGMPTPLQAELPPALSRFSRLLSGKPGATMLVFAYQDANLPPLHALAAALAQQEVAGLEPDWALLEQAPCLDLPLHLMRPGPRDRTP